jgi:hypothetical protein
MISSGLRYCAFRDKERAVSVAKRTSPYVGASGSGISTSAHYGGHKQVKGKSSGYMWEVLFSNLSFRRLMPFPLGD